MQNEEAFHSPPSANLITTPPSTRTVCRLKPVNSHGGKKFSSSSYIPGEKELLLLDENSKKLKLSRPKREKKSKMRENSLEPTIPLIVKPPSTPLTECHRPQSRLAQLSGEVSRHGYIAAVEEERSGTKLFGALDASLQEEEEEDCIDGIDKYAMYEDVSLFVTEDYRTSSFLGRSLKETTPPDEISIPVNEKDEMKEEKSKELSRPMKLSLLVTATVVLCLDIYSMFLVGGFDWLTLNRYYISDRTAYGHNSITIENNDIYPNDCLLACARSCGPGVLRTAESNPPCMWIEDDSDSATGFACRATEYNALSKDVLIKAECSNELDNCLWQGAAAGLAKPETNPLPECSCPSLDEINGAISGYWWCKHINFLGLCGACFFGYLGIGGNSVNSTDCEQC
eukprot:g630.t1